MGIGGLGGVHDGDRVPGEGLVGVQRRIRRPVRGSVAEAVEGEHGVAIAEVRHLLAPGALHRPPGEDTLVGARVARDLPAGACLLLASLAAALLASTSNVVQGAARVVAFPWLTDASKWYLLKTDGVVRPFIFQDREPVEFTALTEDSDEGFRGEKFLYGVRARYRLAYGYWQYAVRMDFTTPT